MSLVLIPILIAILDGFYREWESGNSIDENKQHMDRFAWLIMVLREECVKLNKSFSEVL